MGDKERLSEEAIREELRRRTHLEGKFAYSLQGFMDAQFLVLPEVNRPQPITPDGYRNPPVIQGYRPLDYVEVKDDGTVVVDKDGNPVVKKAGETEISGYYPYSEAGYFVFNLNGTFTGVFRLNFGGNSGPFYSTSREFHGDYVLSFDGTGSLTFKDNGTTDVVCFIVMVDENEALLHLVWVNTAARHRRSTGTGWMKRMDY